jgi:hypothetical protein
MKMMKFTAFFVNSMASKPLDALRKGLKTLNDRVKIKKDAIQGRLAERKPISAEEEHWLDYDANLVDEQQVLEALESASDYERGFARLNDEQRGLVKKLHEAAGFLCKAAGKKRKCAWRNSLVFLKLTI